MTQSEESLNQMIKEIRKLARDRQSVLTLEPSSSPKSKPPALDSVLLHLDECLVVLERVISDLSSRDLRQGEQLSLLQKSHSSLTKLANQFYGLIMKNRITKSSSDSTKPISE